MQSNTEYGVREEPLEAAQGTHDPTKREEIGGPYLVTEQQTYHCDSVEEFRELEAEIGVAARWTRPSKEYEAPRWESRWRWKPGDGPGWPKYGTDIY